ncbi:N-acetyltransferase [Achromobacter sp. K91]|uniref:GNAT family N-acetyltransferase n=1 Tax=Achromobacter sp. K91 TaxID=2292262 RepID=UPI000E664FCC|nr:GNAT family N-acetyltransferase [Achromobacter sp. K91]RIJ03820.1 N-acetyltransferase [Achromobacter sp. K91]
MSAALLPDTFQTARLQARRMDETDFSFIAAMHADERLMATMGGTRTDSASRRYLLQNVEHWAELGYGMYVLADRASGALAGRAGLKRTQSRGCDEVEVAYAFLPASWGMGYATEIAQALLSLGFGRLPVEALSAVALEENAASCRVLEKCGMRQVGGAGAGGAGKRRYEIRRAEWPLPEADAAAGAGLRR